MVETSIIIRTRNEEKYIGEVLNAVFSQNYKNFEVIIVDSGSTDKTLDIVKNFPVRIFSISPEKFSYGHALNFGFEKSQGKYVVCLSAHSLPTSNSWLEKLISNFIDEKVAAVMGKTLPWPDCNPFDRRGLLRRFNIEKQEITEKTPFNFGNANSAIRKDIWEKLKFNESLTYAEDLEWSRKIINLGYKIIYEPEAVVYHSHNESLKQIQKRFYNEAKALKDINIFTKRYRLLYLFFDLVIGTIYDISYVLLRPRYIRWLFFAPLRRIAMNYGRYKGSRNIDYSATFFEATVKRFFVIIIKKINSFLSSKAVFLTKITGKSKYYIHPKHLIDNPEHYWYLDYINSTDFVLGVGCNNGIHTVQCAKKCKEIWGFDYNLRAVDIAKKIALDNNLKNINFFVLDAEEKWNFKDENFDKIIMLDVLEHINNRDFVLSEVKRVLKRGGLFLFSVPNSQTKWKKLQKKLGLFYYSDPDHKIEYTIEEIKKELEKFNFKLLEIRPIVYDTPWYGLIDFVGGISLRLYSKLSKWKKEKVKNNLNESIGFKIVAIKQ
ncbi:MAG: glycosyltransferase [Elusimicrobiota bacterium]|nr:glycosyltransferase [Endomicrobiia bacterium]MDW8166021.1 glycosyltransferase [Elusimicrobiota bacterium]